MTTADLTQHHEELESYAELRRFRVTTSRDRESYMRRLKELLLGFLCGTLLVKNLVECAVLTSVVEYGGKLTAEATVFYVARDVAYVLACLLFGSAVDRVGYESPILSGTAIMFLSTAMLACGARPLLFLITRAFHGVASSLIEVAALATLADLFPTTVGRTKAFGVALEIASLGVYSDTSSPLVNYLLRHLGQFLFLLLAFLPLVSGALTFFLAAHLKRQEAKEFQSTRPSPIPLWKLLTDGYVLIGVSALFLSHVPLVFLQRTVDRWGRAGSLDAASLEILKADTAWFQLLSHVLGMTFAILLTAKYPNCRWLTILNGLLVEGACCVAVPAVQSFEVAELIVCGVSFAVGATRVVLLSTLACVVEVRHGAVFGGVYALAALFTSLAFVAAPLIAYLYTAQVGFGIILLVMGLSMVLYAPTLYLLRRF